MSLLKELVSVIIPVYNSEKYIEECLNCVMGQTYGEFEIVVVNDGSTDSSEKIINALKEKDNRIKYVKQENAGAGEARNTGIQNASGKYVIFLDSDDKIKEDYIEKLVNEIVTKQQDIVCSGEKYFDATKGLNKKVSETLYQYTILGATRKNI